MQPPRNGSRGDGVRRGHDGAEGDGLGPPHAGEGNAGRRRDSRRGGENQPHRQQRDRPDVLAEFAERGEVGRRPEDRRQEYEEDEIRVQPDDRQAGHKGQPQSADHEEDGIGNQEPLRDRREQQHDSQQQDDDLDLMEA